MPIAAPPMTPFTRILIANRGEIAARVIRTARALGYMTVAVYSTADRDAPHVALADQAVPIGSGPEASNSYLDIGAIIAAARRSGAEAIHPGYGFLSENADFAQACAAAGLIFIGPSADIIRIMGNKAEAKRCAVRAAVGCVPGYEGSDQADATFVREADTIGYPVMIKAASGGGGKGMRLVASPEQLPAALASARLEASAAFGSAELLLERALAAASHIEIQVFGDQRGNIIHLFERDCSIQRRHQKVIEEAPSPSMTPQLRERMGEAAVSLAKAVGYVGAGTVEFLVTADRQFYFLEMNTRLQVEHAVTEEVTGLDLVEWQLRVAAGEALPVGQADVRLCGHAIEARLYAEDPAENFLPQSGTIRLWMPPAGVGLRLESGVGEGTTVTPYYDPMLAKLIAHGATREEARRRLLSGLQRLVVLGIATNREFLMTCLRHPDFVAGQVDTSFIDARLIDEHLSGGTAGRETDRALRALAAVLLGRVAAAGPADPLGGWSSTGTGARTVMLEGGGPPIAVTLRPAGPDTFAVVLDGQTSSLELIAQTANIVRLAFDGLVIGVFFAWDGASLYLATAEATACFQDASLRRRSGSPADADGAVRAPMAGVIVAINAEKGQFVERGDTLLVLTAMKMEMRLTAPIPGFCEDILVRVGEQVPVRKLLTSIRGGSRDAA